MRPARYPQPDAYLFCRQAVSPIASCKSCTITGLGGSFAFPKCLKWVSYCLPGHLAAIPAAEGEATETAGEPTYVGGSNGRTRPDSGRPRAREREGVSQPGPESTKFVQQRFGLFEVGGIEALGEPIVDWCQEVTRLLAFASLAPKARQVTRCAEFP
jgi:hypothetical protein